MPVAVLAVMMTTGLPIMALAQRDASRPVDSQVLDPQPLESQGRAQAPIGHRQPRPQDLPPSVLRDEEGGGSDGTRAQQNFDKDLQICKGC